MYNQRAENVSLSEKLRIAPEEVKATAARMRFLLKVKEEGTVHQHVELMNGEWETLVTRLNKGKELLEQENTPKREKDLYNLYLYLLTQIAIYDLFFKNTLSESHYCTLKDVILNRME